MEENTFMLEGMMNIVQAKQLCDMMDTRIAKAIKDNETKKSEERINHLVDNLYAFANRKAPVNAEKETNNDGMSLSQYETLVKTRKEEKVVNENKALQFEELEKAVKPMIDFLNKYYDPMTTAIITEDRIDIVRNEMGMSLVRRDD